MTRIRLNADGTRTMLSFSHYGAGDADAELARSIESIDESNRKALEIWGCLSEEERQRRIHEFKVEAGK